MNMEYLVKEVIVVEGRDDIDAVKKAVNADVIATHDTESAGIRSNASAMRTGRGESLFSPTRIMQAERYAGG